MFACEKCRFIVRRVDADNHEYVCPQCGGTLRYQVGGSLISVGSASFLKCIHHGCGFVIEAEGPHECPAGHGPLV